MPAARLLAACAAALAAAAGAAHAAGGGLLTILDGDAVVLREDVRLAAAEGLALQPGDIVATGPQARLARIELADGTSLALGPSTQALLQPGHGVAAEVVVLDGWAKLAAPADASVTLDSPALAVRDTGGTAVLQLPPAAPAVVFAETGPLRVRPRAGDADVVLQTGQALTLAPGAAQPQVAPRPPAGFVGAMPRPFMDTLPPRAAAFRGRIVAPHVLGPVTWADARPWIDGEPALRALAVQRWKKLARRDPEFRRQVQVDIKSHPEWLPVLAPPRSGVGADGR